MPPNYFDTIPDTRATHQQGVKQQQDLQSMLDELKKLQMATMMSQSKPSVVLTDQTDLGDKMDNLTNQLVESISKLKGSNIDDLGVIKALSDGVNGIKAVHEAQGKQHGKHLQAIMTAIKGIDLQPQVTVKSEPVDFSPLKDMLGDSDEDEDLIDFDDYKASDINNDDPNKQYVGFLNPNGDWYIIENDVKGNSMRYVFGSGNYAKAFAKASTYKYQLLDAAAQAFAGSTADDDENEDDDAEA